MFFRFGSCEKALLRELLKLGPWGRPPYERISQEPPHGKSKGSGRRAQVHKTLARQKPFEGKHGETEKSKAAVPSGEYLLDSDVGASRWAALGLASLFDAPSLSSQVSACRCGVSSHLKDARGKDAQRRVRRSLRPPPVETLALRHSASCKRSCRGCSRILLVAQNGNAGRHQREKRARPSRRRRSLKAFLLRLCAAQPLHLPARRSRSGLWTIFPCRENSRCGTRWVRLTRPSCKVF